MMKYRLRSARWIAVAAYILSILVCIAAYTVTYLTTHIQVESFSQVLYTIRVSMGGAENTIVQILTGFFQSYFLVIVVLTLILVFFLHYLKTGSFHSHHEGRAKRHIRFVTVSAIVACLASTFLLGNRLVRAYEVLGIEKYLEERSHFTKLYEDNYVDPKDVAFSFPSEKRNLIYIYVESMESTYTTEEYGGGMETNDLIPNLRQLAMENNDFSAAGSSTMNGGYVTNYTSWTVAGMVAQTSGTPLAMGNDEYVNNFAESKTFMPYVTTLGEILEKNGYQNYLMCGSDSSYAGRKNYFTQHGNYSIFDLKTARKEGKIPADFKEWWGFSDQKLFTYAQEKILELADQDQPFNFTMLTADTHFRDGFLCPLCEDEFDEQMENVIACSDRQIAEFIEWVQQQDFYENTTIIISGDHLSMDGLIPQIIPDGYQRKTYFTVINGPAYPLDYDRTFTTLDIFPTTLSALGVKSSSDRLGLGTDLYSSTPTLAESMGFDAFNQELSYQSEFYNNVILHGDSTSEEKAAREAKEQEEETDSEKE